MHCVRSTARVLNTTWLCTCWYLSQVSNLTSEKITRILHLSAKPKPLRWFQRRFIRSSHVPTFCCLAHSSCNVDRDNSCEVCQKFTIYDCPSKDGLDRSFRSSFVLTFDVLSCSLDAPHINYSMIVTLLISVPSLQSFINQIRRILQLSARSKLLRYSWHRFGLPNRKRLTPPSARHNPHICFSSVWWTLHLMKSDRPPAVSPHRRDFRSRLIVSYSPDNPCTEFHAITPLLMPISSLELDIRWNQMDLPAAS